METNPAEMIDPENPKFQYLHDHLTERFNQQLNKICRESCQNRNNLITLIEWVSIANPTLAGNLILQRDEAIVRQINGTCKLTINTSKPT